MTRESIFKSFESHPWLSKVYGRLNRAELGLAMSFIASHDHLNKDGFERAAVRLFLDKPKPKHWTAIEELLVCANSAIK